MSMISKQIEELRSYAKDRKGELAKLINDAADTIEMLSEKLHASQMSKCKDCRYSDTVTMSFKGEPITATFCTLTRYIVNSERGHDCSIFNADLSKYDMCYNCKYYGGGGDWGLFCSHEKMYNHIGNFSDKPCEHYERRDDR